MERTPVLRWWFRKARRLHDIHHRSLDFNGRMDKNFGIGFFLFDRIFRTLAQRHCPSTARLSRGGPPLPAGTRTG